MSVIRFSLTAALLGAACLAQATRARADIVINQFLPIAGPTTAGQWYASDVRPGGSASVVSLTGLGGNLETAQPLPTGAALLTTANDDNNAKAEVATFADFGDAASFLSNATMGYSYFKQSVSGQNASAAPAMKIAIAAPNHGAGNDGYGQLVYEPNWNQPGGGSQLPPADAWQTVSISPTDGAGDDASGGWWWSGGFEIPNGAGGPPLRSLVEWVTAFQASDAADFGTARIVGIGMGVGTYNPGQIGYFDNASYAVVGGPGERWDFQAVPEPTTLGLMGAAAGGGLAVRRRRGRSA